MKTIIKSFFLLMLSVQMNAQDNITSPTFEISVSSFQTNFLQFDRDYEFRFPEDVSSSNTFGFNVAGRRTQPFLVKNLNWFVGGRFGVHAYSIDLFLSE